MCGTKVAEFQVRVGRYLYSASKATKVEGPYNEPAQRLSAMGFWGDKAAGQVLLSAFPPR